MSNKKQKDTRQLFRGDPVNAPPSPYHTVIGLKEDDGWYELYQADSESEAKRMLNFVIEDESPIHTKFDDFAVMPPSIEHSIPSSARGQHRAWLEGTLPATREQRRRLAAGPVGQRGRAGRRRLA